MNNKLRLFILCLCICIFSEIQNEALAQHTFSIVAVDPATGEVGSAGASCVDNAANFGGVMLISGIIPGRGAINGQATVCIPHVNLNNAINQMQFGASPDEIVDFLYNNDACQFGNNETRQYGIVDFDENDIPRSAAFTGNQALTYAGHRVGDNYAIQGNILLGPAILDSMEARFLATGGPLAKKLMAAMQGANVPGADSRCLDEGTSSKSAFIRVAKPDDSTGNFYLEINVMQTPDGTEPIDTLQAHFDVWCDTVSTSTDQQIMERSLAIVFPNPSNGHFEMNWYGAINEGLTTHVYNIDGKEILSKPVVSYRNEFQFDQPLMGQLHLLVVKDKEGRIVFQQKIMVDGK